MRGILFIVFSCVNLLVQRDIPLALELVGLKGRFNQKHTNDHTIWLMRVVELSLEGMFKAENVFSETVVMVTAFTLFIWAEDR